MELAGGAAANLVISGHQFQHRTTLETGAYWGRSRWAGRLICQRLSPEFDMHGSGPLRATSSETSAALNAGVAVEDFIRL